MEVFYMYSVFGIAAYVIQYCVKHHYFINYARKTPSFNYGDIRAFHSLTADQEVY